MVRQLRLGDNPREQIASSEEFGKYHLAFENPGVRSTCRKLGKTKAEICHSNGRNSPPCEPCRTWNTVRELQLKKDKMMRCRNYRTVQNASNCFAEVDHGHLEAIVVLDRAIDSCRRKIRARRARNSRSRSASKRSSSRRSPRLRRSLRR